MLGDLIVIILFFFFSWIFILACYMAAAKMKEPDAPTACSGLAAIIITIIAALIL